MNIINEQLYLKIIRKVNNFDKIGETMERGLLLKKLKYFEVMLNIFEFSWISENTEYLSKEVWQRNT